MRQMAIDAIRYRPRWAAIRYATAVAVLALAVGLLTGAL
jgi:hypothetical protein